MFFMGNEEQHYKPAAQKIVVVLFVVHLIENFDELGKSMYMPSN